MVEEKENLFLNCGNEIFCNNLKKEKKEFFINKDIKIIKTPLKNKKINLKNNFLRNLGMSFKKDKPSFSDRRMWYDFDNGEKHALPTLGMGKCDSIRRIDAKIIKKVLTKEYFMNLLIIDCRYPYEYEGGHIEGAINISNQEEMRLFYHKYETTGLIFHCEFSSARAPYLSRILRFIDRNECVYPHLKFPEIYILEGGYKAFYEKYPEHCTPMGYVKMESKQNK